MQSFNLSFLQTSFSAILGAFFDSFCDGFALLGRGPFRPSFADDSDSRVAFVSLDAGMPGVVLKNRVIAQLAEALGPGVCMHRWVLNPARLPERVMR